MTATHIDNLAMAAKAYHAAGLCVLPARRAEKRPAVGAWKQYQQRLPTPAELEAWFANGHDAICILCGGASGDVEMLDFDNGGELFDAWNQRVEAAMPGLVDRLVIETTPRSGWHVAYRCEQAVCGNLKLAQRKQADSKIITLIETRGEGGLFLCAPTDGYELVQGDFASLPVLNEAERDTLLQAAADLNEYVPAAVEAATPAGRGHVSPPALAAGSAARPGDDYNARGDVRDVLKQHGWLLVRAGDNEHWRRPGKESGTSATLKHGVFYVFSSNASPFEPHTAYSPFSVYALLEHGGDYEAAAHTLREQGYGEDSLPSVAPGVDLSQFRAGGSDAERTPEPGDPGPMPMDLLRIPGFVSKVMDHTLNIAPKPNQAMAFAGALALQSLLAGRKVRDPGDNRTNIYLLGLAYSGEGKDQPRKVNKAILRDVAMSDCLADGAASAEGIEDALSITPSMLFQTDEIDTMLQSMNSARESRHEAMMRLLLTMFSSASSDYRMRCKAGQGAAGVIDQPCLSIFGTAIPNHYYEALSGRMLTNGLFSRMMILDTEEDNDFQTPSIIDVPEQILTTARWWAEYQPEERKSDLAYSRGQGTAAHQAHPVPTIVPHTDEGKRLLIEHRDAVQAEHRAAKHASDPVGTTVWSRVHEHACKLALLYAISESPTMPAIGPEAVAWAGRLTTHQARRMLFKAREHVAENEFDAECLKALRKIRAANGQISHSKLANSMRLKRREFTEVIEALYDRGAIEPIEIQTKTKPGRGYRIVQT